MSVAVRLLSDVAVNNIHLESVVVFVARELLSLLIVAVCCVTE